MGLVTFQDAIEHALDYLGGNPSDQALRDAKRAALEAYRTLANAFTWSYLYAHGRVATSAPVVGEPGGITLSYDHPGGAYGRMATIAGGTWPEWAGSGYLLVGEVAYLVAERKSATVLTLDDALNPGADLPAGTPFTLYRDTYLLPEDYVAQDQALRKGNWGGLGYVHPREWLRGRRRHHGGGLPESFTITGDAKYPGRLVLRLDPWPDRAETIDFVYKRRPRPLALVVESAGKAGVSAGGTLVTGSGTAFRPSMVGSVLRLSSTAVRPPTGEIGANPAAFESVIVAHVGPTQVAVAGPAPEALAGVAYSVSDRVDIEDGTMLNAYWRCVEMHLGMVRTLKDKPGARQQYLAALEQAKAADSRSFAGRSPGDGERFRRRLNDHPYSPEIE
jgi:hypothetical protein